MTKHFNKAIEHFGQVASGLQIVPKGVAKKVVYTTRDDFLFSAAIRLCAERLARKITNRVYPLRAAQYALHEYREAGRASKESLREITSFNSEEAEKFVKMWNRRGRMAELAMSASRRIVVSTAAMQLMINNTDERDREEFFSLILEDAQEFCTKATKANITYFGARDKREVWEPTVIYQDLRRFAEANNFIGFYTLTAADIRYLEVMGTPERDYDPYNWVVGPHPSRN